MINQLQQYGTGPTRGVFPCEMEMIRAWVYGAHALLRRDVGEGVTANDIKLPAYRQVDLVAVIADLFTAADYLGIYTEDVGDPHEAIAPALQTADPARGADLLRHHGQVDWPGFPGSPRWLTEVRGTFDDFEQVARPIADLEALAEANGWRGSQFLNLGEVRYEHIVRLGLASARGSHEDCLLCDAYPSVPAANW